ncbi:MAG: acyloxyacyl hydrolase [Acidovorax sp.]
MLHCTDHGTALTEPAGTHLFGLFGLFGRLTALLGAIACSAPGSARATEQPAPSPTPSLYVEAGISDHRSPTTRARTVGLRIPLQYSFWQGRIRTDLDMYLSDWSSTAAPPVRRHTTQLGVVPMFRYRFADGRSPWFVEGGIGLSYLTATYHTPNNYFGSRWNFSDHLGVGLSFGAQQQHEIALHAKHVSNAGLRKPNPGETFVQIRYAHRF